MRPCGTGLIIASQQFSFILQPLEPVDFLSGDWLHWLHRAMAMCACKEVIHYSLSHTRMQTCACRGILSVTMPRQLVNSTLWPLTHFMLCRDSPSCYISLGQEFTVHPSMSREAWCLFLEIPEEEEKRREEKRREEKRREEKVCCQQQQAAGGFIIGLLPSHLDLVSANLIVAFSSTWPTVL